MEKGTQAFALQDQPCTCSKALAVLPTTQIYPNLPDTQIEMPQKQSPLSQSEIQRVQVVSQQSSSHLDVVSGGKKIKYIVVSIIAGWICCLPLGLCATYNACQAKIAAQNRDKEMATIYTSRATTVIVWTILFGLIIILINVLFVIAKI